MTEEKYSKPTPLQHKTISAAVTHNEKAEQICVGKYFLKYELILLEKAIINRYAWLGWMGMFVSTASAWVSVPPEKKLWVIFWALMTGVALTGFAYTALQAFKHRKITIDTFIDRVENR